MKKKNLEIKSNHEPIEMLEAEVMFLDNKKPSFTLNQILEIEKTLNAKKVKA